MRKRNFILNGPGDDGIPSVMCKRPSYATSMNERKGRAMHENMGINATKTDPISIKGNGIVKDKCGKDGSGKDDRADNKPRWELLPLDAVEEIVKVYTMGAQKYADNAWKTIPDAHRRYLAALFRHIAAYERGERKDSESGLSHLAHAAWNAIAILWLDLHKDDGHDNDGNGR